MLQCHQQERSLPVNKELSERIPVISFLMMIEVMLYHCETLDDILPTSAIDSWCSGAITDTVAAFGPLCMSWFFAVTGFLLFRNLSFQNLRKKIQSRVHSLLIPYVLWQVIYIVKSILQGNSWTVYEMIAHIFFLRVWPPLGAFWYIYAVFLLSLLSPLFLFLFRNEKLGGISVFLLIACSCVLVRLPLIPDRGRYYYVGSILTYFPAYITGSFFGHLQGNSFTLSKLKHLVILLFVSRVFTGIIPSLFESATLAALSVGMILLMPVPEWAKNRKVYKLTFLILATHQSLISISIHPIRHFFYSLSNSAAIAGLFGRAFCILFIVAVNAFIHFLMNRFMPRTLKVLTGGRC